MRLTNFYQTGKKPIMKLVKLLYQTVKTYYKLCVSIRLKTCYETGKRIICYTKPVKT